MNIFTNVNRFKSPMAKLRMVYINASIIMRKWLKKLCARAMNWLITHGSIAVCSFIQDMEENAWEGYICQESTSYWEDFRYAFRLRVTHQRLKWITFWDRFQMNVAYSLEAESMLQWSELCKAMGAKPVMYTELPQPWQWWAWCYWHSFWITVSYFTSK